MLLAVLSVVLGAASASAVTVGSGTALAWIGAGAEPCAELCDARWALDRMRGAMPNHVHAEFARRIDAGRPMVDQEVATGDVIVAVSYARAGIPFVDLTRRVAQFPDGVQFPARGHAIAHDDLTYRFVRVETWENWALIVDGGSPHATSRRLGWQSGPARLSIPGIAGSIAGVGGAGGAGGGGVGLAGHREGFAVGTGAEAGPRAQAPGIAGETGDEPLLLLAPPPPDLVPRPVAPMPIPLPGALALLAGGLSTLVAPRLWRAATGR